MISYTLEVVPFTPILSPFRRETSELFGSRTFSLMATTSWWFMYTSVLSKEKTRAKELLNLGRT